MKQHTNTLKRSIAILMTLAMVLSLPTGITMPRQAQAAGYGLNNPTTDSNGVTTWDCVYFGNYWQGATPTPTAPPFSTPVAPHTPTPSPFSTPVAPLTPTPSPYWVPTARPTVTPEPVSAKIILATPTAHSKKVVGKKIMMKEAGNVTPTPEPVITPKPTVQPDPTPTSKVSPTPASNNFKIGSIKWRVLSVDGNDAFLMADQSLDAEPYNNSDASVTWSECTLRSWLNGYDSLSNKAGIDYRNNNFINSAFTNKEKYAIMQTKVSNGDDSDYGGIIGGEDTRDKVYLLSMAEISEESYGFNENFNIESYARMTHDTAYTIWKRGGNYRDIWWLRTAIQGNGAARIYEDGSGHAVANMWPKLGVRPVLHLDLSNTDLWSYAGTVSCEGGSVSVATPTPTDAVGAQERKLQCDAVCTVDVGHTATMCAKAYEDSLDALKQMTSQVTWTSSDPSVARVNYYGFILPTTATTLATANGSKEVWDATGLWSVDGISEGTATITGTAADGSTTTCEVTVTTPTSDSETKGNGGSLILGEDVSGTTDDETAQFFPQNWTLKISSFPITITRKVDQEDGSYTIRGSVGIGKGDWLDEDAKWTTFKKDVEEAKKNSGQNNCLNEYRNTWGVQALNVMDVSKLSKKPTISAMGYFENKYDKNGNKISGTGALAMDAVWKSSVSWQFATPIGPMYLNLSGSGKLSGEIKGEYDYAQKTFPSLDGSVKITPTFSLEGGYGIDKVAAIGAKGSASFPVTILPATKGEIQVEAGVHVKVAFVIDWNHTLAKKSWTMWDTTGKKKLGILDDVSLSDGVLSAMDTSFAKAESKWYPKKDQTSSSRKKAQAQSDTRGIVTTLKEGILPASLPKQVQIGDRKVMVYQAYDASRETLDSSVLKYSVWENGRGSEDRAVCDDGNADLFADMKVVNGKLVLVWQKQKAKTAGDISADSDAVLKEMAQNSEIYCSIFDEETGTFGEAVRVTDNDVCDMMPQICVNGEDITVAWVRNDAGDMMQESGNNSICTAKWNGTDFDGEEVLSQAPGTIDSYTVYEKDGKTEAVYDGQANGINAVFDTNGQVIPALEDLMMDAEDGAVSGLQYTDGAVSMVVNGTLYRYQISDGSVASFSAGESAFGSAVQYCTNGDKSGYIWSRYEEETGKGQILASMKTGDGWSEPVVVCEQEGTYWRYFSPILKEDGDWEIVANAENADSGLNVLVDITKEQANHLQLVSAYVDESDIQDGKTAVRYMVTNTEDTAIDHLDLLVKLADGTIVKKTISVNIAPGASVVDTAYVDLSDVDTEQSVNISAVAEGQDDTTDSSVTDQVGQADVAVEASGEETEDQLTITAVVKNTSTMAADTDVYLYGDEKKSSLLQSRKGITLQADGSKQLTFTVDKKDITYNKNKAAYLTLYAESKGGDYDMDNNTAYVILYQEDQEPSATPTVKPTVTPSVKPTVSPTIKPSVRPTVIPGANAAKNPTHSSTAPNTSVQKLRKGQRVKDTKTKAYYKILSITSSGGTVAYVKPVGKKSKSITIAASAVLDGHTFKVVAVSAKAYKGCSKLQKVTIGKNITSIGKNAFAGCKKLKKITIKSTKLKSSSIGKNAFKGTAKKLTVKVPKKQYKVYKKFLKKKGNGMLKVIK